MIIYTYFTILKIFGGEFAHLCVMKPLSAQTQVQRHAHSSF